MTPDHPSSRTSWWNFLTLRERNVLKEPPDEVVLKILSPCEKVNNVTHRGQYETGETPLKGCCINAERRAFLYGTGFSLLPCNRERKTCSQPGNKSDDGCGLVFLMLFLSLMALNFP
ncbi:hypothetical protein AVEN_32068-1 [Araneus ventricosus]|uniref:Uncharacterized protein n=1 Tax=Araneus ventricosus TaxID=182803 RepID=A0A4Y2ECJ7_ARAVE|nr:hypothetical protein AVEN_32068-1 [Araneus ventricosus]